MGITDSRKQRSSLSEKFVGQSVEATMKTAEWRIELHSADCGSVIQGFERSFVFLCSFTGIRDYNDERTEWQSGERVREG